MACDLEKTESSVVVLAVHPGWVPTRMTGYHGVDDMEMCMNLLVSTIKAFGTDAGHGIPNGGYVSWDGEDMKY